MKKRKPGYTMTKQLRNILIVCGAALLLPACKQSREPEPPFEPLALAFSGGTEAGEWDRIAPTRAVYPVGGKFGVLAYDTQTIPWATAGATTTPGFLYNQMVEKTAGGTTYDPIRYWSYPEQTITFFAYSPHNGAGITLSDNQTAGAPYIDFTAPATPNTDLLGASAADRSAGDGTINFQFTHLLSRVRISAKVAADASQYTATVTGLKLVGLKNSGRYTWANNQWSGQSGAVTFTLLSGATTAIPYNAAAPNVALSDSYMLPQAVTAASKIEISYTIASPFEENPVQRTAQIDLTGMNWDPAKNIHYVVTIRLSDVSFTLQVNDWTENPDPSGGSTVLS